MESLLERVELEALASRDDDLAVEHAALGELGLERVYEFREVAIERLFVPALNEHLVSVAEDERAEPIPFRFEDPTVTRWQLADSLREHREDGRIDGEVHRGMIR